MSRMRSHTIGLATLALAALSLTGCGGSDKSTQSGSKVSHAVAAACTDLRNGDWSSLKDSSGGDGLYDVDVQGPTPQFPVGGGGFPDRLSNTAIYGNASLYLHVQGNATASPDDWEPNGMAPFDWTRGDALREGKDTFDAAWETCAANDPGFPSTVDAHLEKQISEGAALSYRQ